MVRHGETVWNCEGRWQGWQDSPLTERGIGQAQNAAQALKDSGAVAIYCSDAGRARDTARIIGEPLGLTPIPEAAFRERFFGSYEGLTSLEIDAKFPGTRFEFGKELRENWRPVGGESLVEVGARVITALRILAEKYPSQSVIVVTHGGVLRVLDAVATRQPLGDTWDRAPHNCGTLVLDMDAAGDMQLVQHFWPHWKPTTP